MQNNLQQLLQSWNGDASAYELIPLLIVATLLCVGAAVIAYKLVSLFFLGTGQNIKLEGPQGWRGWLYRWLFPDSAQSHQKLVDELQKLRTLLASSDQEKATLMEHQQRDQRRLADQQREIEVLQGQVNEKRAALNAETDKLNALTQHARHLEKQLEEIMKELERIYANATQREIPGMPSAAEPAKPAEPIVTPPPEHDPQAEKLKDIFLAYQKRVAERKRAG